jgi:hypothetical protein
MILIIIIVSAALYAFSYILSKKSGQTIFSMLMGLIFAAALVLLTVNFTDHFGMEKVSKEKTMDLVSSAGADSGMDVLLYQPIGTGDEKVYLYQTAGAKKPKPTDTEKTSNVVESADKAQLVVEKISWKYTNNFYKALFAFAGNDNQLEEVVNHFKIPDTWATLSVDQVKELQKLATERQVDMAKTMQAAIQQEVMAAMKKNPKMTKAEQQALVEKLTAEKKAEAMQALIAEVTK